MAQRLPMPIGNYAWCEREEIEQLDWKSMDDDQDTGYIAEVDLEYPSSLHASHSSFPLCPEHTHITGDMLSAYSRGKT